MFSGDKDSASDEIELDSAQQQALNDEAAQNTAPIQDAIKEELDSIKADLLKEDVIEVTSKKIGKDGLCEDYFFEQGDSLRIVDHTIQVNKIADDALRLNVDGKNYVLAEKSSDIMGDGIELAIASGNIIYFGVDDSSNSAMIRIGCDYDDDPSEKYVQNRGENLCEEIYENCQQSFNIDLSE